MEIIMKISFNGDNIKFAKILVFDINLSNKYRI